MTLNVKVIIGSTRPGRVGPKVATWVRDTAAMNASFNVELLDLVDFNLPLLDEPAHPAMQQYEHQHTKEWSRSIAAGDAFIFVIPEYDFFPSAAVINAVQTLYREWERKPAGVVSYGGISGGLRSSQVFRSLLSCVNIHALPQAVPVPFVSEFIASDAFAPSKQHDAGLEAMLIELDTWGRALRVARQA